MATLVKKNKPLTNQQHKQDSVFWLKRILQPQKALLHSALILAVIAGLLFILQSALLAALFSDWLLRWQQKQQLQIDTTLLLHTLPGLLLCFIGRPLLQFGRERLAQIASLRIRQQLRLHLLENLSALGPSRQTLGSDGALSTQILEQVDALDGFISRYYVQRYLVILIPLLLLIATFYYSPLAAAILLLTAPLVPVFMILVGKAAAGANQQQLTALGQLGGRFLDLVRGMKTLRHLNATTLAQDQIAYSAEQYQYRSMKVLRLAFLSGAVLELFASLAIALVALYLGLGLLGILPWAKGEIPVPYQAALFILLLAPEFYAPLRQLGNDYHAKAQAEAAITELLPLLNAQPWQHNGNTPLVLQQAPAITLEKVSLQAANGRQRLAPTSFQLSAAERIVLQGASGCGKSSLLEMLLCFIPYQGKVLINDKPLSQLERTQWWSYIGFLSQQSQILHGTVKSNLQLAAPDATDQQLIHALQQVELWPLLQQLPLALDTPLGERGLGLSGGQLQRLAIAQLLLRDTKIWLLDEPAAHLDPATGYRIYQLLGRLSHGKTVIVVSHHLHGLDWADRVLHLQPVISSADTNTPLTPEAEPC